MAQQLIQQNTSQILTYHSSPTSLLLARYLSLNPIAIFTQHFWKARFLCSPPCVNFSPKWLLLDQHTVKCLCLPFPSLSHWFLLTSSDWSCNSTVLHFNNVDSNICKPAFSSLCSFLTFLTCLSPSYPFRFRQSISTAAYSHHSQDHLNRPL